MKAISLFTGLGILDRAAESAGIEVIVQCEIDQAFHQNLSRLNPSARLFADITEIDETKLPYADIIFGGDPCQPHSISGKRKGTEDPRFLWPHFARIVAAVRPPWVVNENVTGTISNMVLDGKISDLEALGYTCEAYCLPAVAIGANNKRNRVFLVAHTDRQQRNDKFEMLSAPELDKWAHQTVQEKEKQAGGLQWEWEHARGHLGRIYPIPDRQFSSGLYDGATELVNTKGLGNAVNPWIAQRIFSGIKAIHTHLGR